MKCILELSVLGRKKEGSSVLVPTPMVRGGAAGINSPTLLGYTCLYAKSVPFSRPLLQHEKNGGKKDEYSIGSKTGVLRSHLPEAHGTVGCICG